MLRHTGKLLLLAILFAEAILPKDSKKCVVSVHEGGQILVDKNCGKTLDVGDIQSKCQAKTKLRLEDANGKVITGADLGGIPATLFFGRLNKNDPSKTELIATETVFSEADGTVVFKNVPCFTRKKYEEGNFVSGFIYNSENRPDYNPLYKRKETQWDAVEKDQFEAFYLDYRQGDTFIDKDVTKILLTGEKVSALKALKFDLDAATIDQPTCSKTLLDQVTDHQGQHILSRFVYSVKPGSEYFLDYKNGSLVPRKQDEIAFLSLLAKKEPIALKIHLSEPYLRFKEKAALKETVERIIDTENPEPIRLCLVKNRSFIQVEDEKGNQLTNFQDRKDLITLRSGSAQIRNQLQLELDPKGFYLAAPFLDQEDSVFELIVKGQLYKANTEIDWSGSLRISHRGKGITVSSKGFASSNVIRVKTKSSGDQTITVTTPPIVTTEPEPNPPIILNFENVPSHEKIELTKDQIQLQIADLVISEFELAKTGVNSYRIDFKGNYNSQLKVRLSIKGFEKYSFRETVATENEKDDKTILSARLIAQPKVRIILKGLAKPLPNAESLNFELLFEGDDIDNYTGVSLEKNIGEFLLKESDEEGDWQSKLEAKVSIAGYLGAKSKIAALTDYKEASYQLVFWLRPKIRLVIDQNLQEKYADQINEEYIKKSLKLVSNQAALPFEVIDDESDLIYIIAPGNEKSELDSETVSKTILKLPDSIPLVGGQLLLEEFPNKDYIYWAKLNEAFIVKEVYVPLLLDGKLVSDIDKEAKPFDIFSLPGKNAVGCLETVMEGANEQFLFFWKAQKQRILIRLRDLDSENSPLNNMADAKYMGSSNIKLKINPQYCGPYVFTNGKTEENNQISQALTELSVKLGGDKNDFKITFNGVEGIHIKDKPKFRFEVETAKEGKPYPYSGILNENKTETKNDDIAKLIESKWSYPPYVLCIVDDEAVENCDKSASPGFSAPLAPLYSGENSHVFKRIIGNNSNPVQKTSDKMYLLMQFLPDQSNQPRPKPQRFTLRKGKYEIWEVKDFGIKLLVNPPTQFEKDWQNMPIAKFQKETMTVLKQYQGTTACLNPASKRPNHETDRFYFDFYSYLINDSTFGENEWEREELKKFRSHKRYNYAWKYDSISDVTKRPFAHYAYKKKANGKFCSWWQMAKHEGCPMISLFTLAVRQGKYPLTAHGYAKWYLSRMKSDGISLGTHGEGMAYGSATGEKKILSAISYGGKPDISFDEFKETLNDPNAILGFYIINGQMSGYHYMPCYRNKEGDMFLMDFNQPGRANRKITLEGLYNPDLEKIESWSTFIKREFRSRKTKVYGKKHKKAGQIMPTKLYIYKIK